jgi:hypothetical protein
VEETEKEEGKTCEAGKKRMGKKRKKGREFGDQAWGPIYSHRQPCWAAV